MSGRGKSAKSLALLAAARSILLEEQPTSVRAVCYRLFTQGLIPNMEKAATNRVSAQLTWAREQGLIPWEWICDETREPEVISAWENPAAYVETVKRSYRRDRWTGQPERIEVWSEKGTVRGALRPVLDTYGVTFRVLHGYGSATALKQAADDSRLRRLTVFYVGDWDPSGLHMSEVDLPARLKRYGADIELQRIALVPKDLPRLPSFSVETKQRDSRYAWYVAQHGRTCWELDALKSSVLRKSVERAIRARLDLAAWHRADVAEQAERESLVSILNAWPTNSRHAQK